MIATLIDAGASMNFNREEHVALEKAVVLGWDDVLGMLFSAGLDVNCVNKFGNPLLITVQAVEMFRFLVNAVADVNKCGPKGGVLLSSIEHLRLDVFKEVLSSGVDVNWVNCDGKTPLHYAAWYGGCA